MRSIDGSNDKNVKFLLFEHFSEIILSVSSTLLMDILGKKVMSLRRDKSLLLVDLVPSRDRCGVSSFLNLDHIALRAGRKVEPKWRWCKAEC